jgi:hypothetical protein
MDYEAPALELLSNLLYHVLTTDGKLCPNVVKSSTSEKPFQAYSLEELWKLSCGDFIPSVIAVTVASICQQRRGK